MGFCTPSQTEAWIPACAGMTWPRSDPLAQPVQATQARREGVNLREREFRLAQPPDHVQQVQRLPPRVGSLVDVSSGVSRAFPVCSLCYTWPMRKRLKRKRRACGLCKPHKRAMGNRWKTKDLALLKRAESEIRLRELDA